jgi:putative replication protein
MRHKSGDLRNDDWLAMGKAIAGLLGKGGATVGLFGGRGMGKTQMAVELGITRLRAGDTVLWLTMSDLYMRVRETYGHPERSERGVLEMFLNIALLVVDQLEAQPLSENVAHYLDYIVDGRYYRMRDTILVSNQRRIEFEQTLGRSIVTRIEEEGGFFECEWENSFREKGPDDGRRTD